VLVSMNETVNKMSPGTREREREREERERREERESEEKRRKINTPIRKPRNSFRAEFIVPK